VSNLWKLGSAVSNDVGWGLSMDFFENKYSTPKIDASLGVVNPSISRFWISRMI
jgi:hypothetical protein